LQILIKANVMKHFEDIHEDQFDFHAYCIRKVTLRAYCDVLQWEDELWGQVYYRQAAEGTIRVYLTLYDNPALVSQVQEPDYSALSAAERKKAKAAARKKKKVGDDDMEGKDLILKDSLEECRKLVSLLTKHAPKELSTWLLQYDVSIRRGRPMMALQVCFFWRQTNTTLYIYMNGLTNILPTFLTRNTGFIPCKSLGSSFS
jgi:N-alpha-acetyltransferase 15/16, NatA auxiliary subunit